MGKHVDEDTGELWDGAAEVEGIRKALNYRQCYITRMPVEDSGAFWNATIYSPRDPKMGPKLSLPLKNALDPQRYGGYSSQQFAYFFIYEARDKKGCTVFRFAEVPVWLAPRIRVDEGALEAHARRLAEGEKLQFVSIQRAKLLKKQLIEIDDDRLIITGAEEVRNATQYAFSAKEQGLIIRAKEIAQGKVVVGADSSAPLDELFADMIARGKNVAAGLMKKLNLLEKRSEFAALSPEQKSTIILQLAAIVNAANRQIDISSIGGAKTAGQYKVTFSKVLSDSNVDFYIIDQSVTGMFERRTRVGL